MSDHDQNDPAERNVERLLSEAYLPADPPPAFFERERASLRSLARDMARERAAATPTPAPAPPPPVIPFAPQAWRWGLVAAVFLVGFALLLQLGRQQPGPAPTSPQASVERDGPVVWIDGQPYVLKTDAQTRDTQLVRTTPPEPRQTPPAEPAGPKPLVTPRDTQPAPEAPLLRAGQVLATADGARRVRLEDGSVLFVDRGSKLKVTGHRAVRLTQGRVFVEVSPRQGQDPGATFVVRTAGREVKALGTKFAVAADLVRATEVLVTQGAVRVSGVADVLRAGWKLSEGAAGETRVQPLSRMSHELDWTRELVRASQTPLVPGSKHAGGALIAVDPFGQETKLTLRDYKVDVHIEDGFARTTIDQTYFNHEPWRMEGTFYFPLPPGASISRLAMYVAGKRMEGGMAERDHARSVFEQIRFTRRDPALLEWLDGSTFKMRVFPLEGRQEKRIVLSYVQRLESAYGKTTYRFPSGHSLGVVGELGYRVRVAGHGARGWSSPSHDLVAAPAAGDLELGYERTQALMKDDLVLELDDATTKRADRPRLTQMIHEGQRYLMLRTRPSLKRKAARTPRKRTYLFLFEASGDRDPLLARTQQEVVKTFLDNAEHSDQFQLLTAGTRVRALAKQPRPIVASTTREAMAFLGETHLIGALDLGQAFAALKPLAEAAAARGREPVIVHVGSGIPALAEREQAELVGRLPAAARYVGVGVGKRWGRSLMKAAAARSGGVYARINPDEEVRWRAYEVFSLLRTPSLTDLVVRDPARKGTTFLLADEVVYHGGEVCAVTRLPADAALPKRLEVAGKVDGAAFTQSIPVAQVAPKAGYLPRFWALLELDRLIADGAAKHKAEIVKLSMQSYVMSPFTSLLVLENEQMYEQFKVDRGRKDHWAAYACPDEIEVVHDPLPRQRTATTQRGKRAPQRRVLDTIAVRVPMPLLTVQGYPHAHARLFLTVNQLLAGGVRGVGWFDNGIRWRGFYKYYDPSGQAGMNRWARQNGLATPGQQRRLGDLGYSGAQWGRRDRTATTTLAVAGEAALKTRLGGRFQPQAETATRGTLALTALDGLSRRWSSGRGNFALELQPSNGLIDFRRLIMVQPGTQQQGLHSLLFRPPYFSHNVQATFDLLAFAPALNTTAGDVRHTLRREARLDPKQAAGTIDRAAARLVARARAAGWSRIRVPADVDGAAFDLVLDGRGRFAYERVLSAGLTEVGVCDGTNLWHLYPELGLGARRVWSGARFASLRRWAAWSLPAVAELARGHDVLAQGKQTVVVRPKGADPKRGFTQHELVFGADERLATRRVVAIAADGSRKVVSETDLVALREQRAERDAPAADLTPETKDLVVLSFPLRTQAQVRSRLVAALGQAGFNKGPATWSEEQALAWIGAHLTSGHQVLQIVRERFFKRDDRRVGFHVLIVAAGGTWSDGDRLARFSADLGPSSTVELFLEGCRRMLQRWDWRWLHQRKPAAFAEAVPLIRDLSRLQHLLSGTQSGWLRRGKGAKELERKGLEILGWAQEAGDPTIAWALVQLLTQQHLVRRDHPELRKGLDQVYARLAQHPGLGYAARYQRAVNAVQAGQPKPASARFLALHAEELAAGRLPRIEASFVQALERGHPSKFAGFVKRTVEALRRAGRHAELPGFAWQCWQLGQRAAADQVIEQAQAGLPKPALEPTLLRTVEVLRAMQQLPRAARVIARLRKERPKLELKPHLWRLVSAVDAQRGKASSALKALEKAIELEYAELPEVVNLQTVRTDFGLLMTRYQQVAQALATLEQEPPAAFVARIVRAADRWRLIDPDVRRPCLAAARVLRLLGVEPLAWDYATTPIAQRPDEAAPWLELARQAQQWNDIDLASRSFDSAFAAEATNAQILWEHARALQQAGRSAKARALYRKLAEGKWQPRFRWIQQQAQQYTGG